MSKPEEVVVFSPEQSKVADLLLDRIDRQAKLIAARKVSEADLRDLTALATRIEMDAAPFGDLGAQCCHSLPALKRAIAALSPIKEQSDE